jgi:GNAT superfamily N-acetyltransferase
LRRFGVQRRQPGFVLAEARHGGYLVGYASGMPLRPSTSWWQGLTAQLPTEVTVEHPGRTFALLDLLVRAPWRRQGIGQALHDVILANRAEERATVTVVPAATAAQSAFRKWGWRKIARKHDNDPGSPASDVLIAALPR